ncbi:hypothetical protein CYMTET_12997 [Cymbomonas tetramitiformis]|uniref:Uncharacterized protein n=1 Tax=Cymbomonas tetramitiformis TaxID=36881 RepID=A0AAE0LBB0_9CHLO|nr:hypothetical protein CYMTET_12997 [Cymbomonas tetramitiformis]
MAKPMARKDLDTYNSKLQELQLELDNRNITIRSVQRNYENLSSALQGARRELDELTRQLEVEQGSASDLTTKLDKACTRAHVAETKLAELQKSSGSFSDLKSECEQLKFEKGLNDERIQSLQKKIDISDVALKEQKVLVAKLTQNLDSAVKSQDRAVDERRQADKRAATAEDELKSMQSEYRACRDHISQLQNDLNCANRDLQKHTDSRDKDSKYADQQIEKLRKESADMDISLKALQVAHDSEKGQRHLIESQLENASKQLENMKERNSGMGEKLEEKHRAERQMTNKVTTLTAEIASYQEELKLERKRYTELLEQKAKESGSAEHLSKEAKAAQDELARTRAELNLKNEALAKQSLHAEEAQKKLEEELGQAKLAAKFAEKDFKDKLRGRDLRFEKCEKMLKNLEGQITAKLDVRENQLISYEQISVKINGWESQIKQLENKLSQLERTSETLQRDIENALRTMSGKLQKEEGLAGKVMRLQQELKTMTKSEGEQRDARNAAELKMAVLAGDLEKTKRSIAEEAKLEGDRIRKELKKAEEALDALKKCADAEKETSLALLKTEKEKHHLTIDGLKGTILSTHDVVAKVSTDLSLVSKHLASMGVSGKVQEMVFNYADSAPKEVRGSGQELFLAAKELRSQFALLTETVQVKPAHPTKVHLSGA